MHAYSIYKIAQNINADSMHNLNFKFIKNKNFSDFYFLIEYFTYWYQYKSTKNNVLNSLRTYYTAGFNATMMVLDLQHEILYFVLEPEYVDIEHSLPFAITDYYSEETTPERLAHYMIKNNLIDYVSMKFKNFCELCEQWDQLYINTPNYIVLYQTTADTQILLATFNTEQEAVDFVEGKPL